MTQTLPDRAHSAPSTTATAARRPYPAYRDSGVPWLGQIPAHWEVKRLRFMCQLNPGKSEVADLPDNTEVSFLLMEAIGEEGELSLETIRLLDEVRQGYTYFRDGDVIVAKITPCFENGKGALCNGLTNGIGFGTTELHVVRCNDGSTEQFLYCLTKTHPFREIGKAMMQGAAGQQRVPEGFIKDFTLGWPPLDEQRAIAAYLDRETTRLDALIAAKQRLIALLREKRAALISHAVTRGLDASVPLRDSGVPWLGQIPAHWQVQELRRLIQPETVITYGIIQAGPDIEDGIPYIRTGDMAGTVLPENGYQKTSSEIDKQYSRSKVTAGDIVVAIRATVGKALMVPKHLEGANLTQGTARVSPGPSICGAFLLYAIQSPGSQQRFAALSKGATFREITLDMLRRFKIPVPPIYEQTVIAAYLDRETASIDMLTTAIEQQIEKLREYRSAVIAAAVTGQFDVR